MGLVSMGVPQDLALFLQSQFAISTFVETGTYQGATARWASEHFETVVTFEASHELWRRASQASENIKNIRFIHGHSGSLLKTIIQSIQGDALFWLDAHWSGGETHGQSDECPLLDELNALRGSTARRFILIDDARLFTAPPPEPHNWQQWPSLDQVCSSLGQVMQSPFICIVDDVIVCVPDDAREPLVEFLRARPVPVPPSPWKKGIHRVRRVLNTLNGR